MSVDRYNFATELIIQVVCFYIGVALFIGICMIPPIIVLLPYALPLTFMVCIIVNIGFIIRFVKGTQKELEEVQQEFGKYIDINPTTLEDILTAAETTTEYELSKINLEGSGSGSK
jgi:hypothetical protein